MASKTHLKQLNIKDVYGELSAKHNNGKIAIHEGYKNGNKLAAWAAEDLKNKIPNTIGFLVENKALKGEPFGSAAKNWSKSDEGDPDTIKRAITITGIFTLSLMVITVKITAKLECFTKMRRFREGGILKFRFRRWAIFNYTP
ncbi:hypothetical protein FP435_03645 [Lactobacillus sp. PV037]|uniref:hypothetical protein n=1 Tax=Lactobacillus sp. PV037 TaxID=2594496 RepID=UPI00223EAF1D|nr:hypothetical protein [Lactobacillus sp. PV037]QNQ83600.1 hypothetical protein FP435_03645 [Lactobacillus sp. PV037]